MKNRHAWLLTAAFGIVLSSLFQYPGFLNGDSLWQLNQARSGVYDDWHPVLLSYLWHFLNPLAPGGGAPYLLQTTLFWLGLSRLAHQAIPRFLTAALYTCAVGFFPPVLASLSVIGKDATLTGTLLLAAAMLVDASRDRSLRALFVGTVLLAFAVGVRHNGIFAVLGLAPWLGSLYRRQFPKLQSAARPFVVGVGVVALCLGINACLERIVIHPTRGHAGQQIEVFDLAAISIRTNVNWMPFFYARKERPYGLDELRRVFDSYDVYPLLWGPKERWAPHFISGDDQSKELRTAWLTAIVTHPLVYLAHRLHVFVGFLGFGPVGTAYWIPADALLINDPQFNWPRATMPLKQAFLGAARFFERSWFCQAWFYLVMIGLWGFFSKRQGLANATPFYALTVSALVSESSYFFIAPGLQFRYSWWLMAVALVLPLFIAWRPFPESLTPAPSMDVV